MVFVCELKSIFHKRKIKQFKFAEKIGITQAALSQICTEKTLPSFEIMYRICEELDMDVRSIWVRIENQPIGGVPL